MAKVVQIDVDEYNSRIQMIYTDGTGRFPKTSRQGMNYVLVLAEIDSDEILADFSGVRGQTHLNLMGRPT
jgi:hypothetical protein